MNKTDTFKQSFAKVHKTHIQEINVNVAELILTPLTCASIINEIIKCLIYQKSQVPYPYNWLQSVVNRKRKNTENQVQPINLTVERHYRVVSTAFDELEELTKNISVEFKNCGNDIKQVLILFGPTIYGPKEAFNIKLTGLAKGHSEENHLRVNSRNQYKILKNIVLAQEWTTAMENALPPTNMYVMIQKNTKCDQAIEENFFLPVPNRQYSLPLRSKSMVVNLDRDECVQSNCCDNLLIFEDWPKEKIDQVIADDGYHDSNSKCAHNDSNCDLVWFQAKVVLKGFKECYINNVSATELW